MRDEDKPFICYQHGWSMKIVPRGAEGWRALILWLLSLVPLSGLFIWVISREPGGGVVIAVNVLYLLALLIWSVAMIRWMKARSEMIDLAEIERLRRDARRPKGRNRP